MKKNNIYYVMHRLEYAQSPISVTPPTISELSPLNPNLSSFSSLPSKTMANNPAKAQKKVKSSKRKQGECS